MCLPENYIGNTRNPVFMSEYSHWWGFSSEAAAQLIAAFINNHFSHITVRDLSTMLL